MQANGTTAKIGIFGKICNILERFVEFVAMISVGAMGLILILAVLFRYVFKSPLTGAEEVAMFLLAWLTFLGASIAIRRNEMVAVTFVLDVLPNGIKKSASILIQILIIGFSVILFYYGYTWLFSSNVMNATSAALRIPMWLPNLMFPLSMLIMTIFCLDNIRNLLKNKL